MNRSPLKFRETDLLRRRIKRCEELNTLVRDGQRKSEVNGFMDLIKELRAFTFASRLKRLGDRLSAEASCIYHHRGVDFNDSWFLIGYLLSRNESMTITEIAKAVGISRPVISEMMDGMVKHGLITISTDWADSRRRCLTLTPDGKEAVEMLEPVWNAIGECTEELLSSSGVDVLEALSTIETGLESSSLFRRVTEKLSHGGAGHDIEGTGESIRHNA
jgi:DNA-binding MarR family transcriptional regulator